MKKKMSNITIYASSDVRIFDDLKVEVDDYGEEWLSPSQIDYLETLHLLARYTVDNILEITDKLFVNYQQPVVESKEYSNASPITMIKSTPMSLILMPS